MCTALLNNDYMLYYCCFVTNNITCTLRERFLTLPAYFTYSRILFKKMSRKHIHVKSFLVINKTLCVLNKHKK